MLPSTITSASTVGLPLESKISLPRTSVIFKSRFINKLLLSKKIISPIPGPSRILQTAVTACMAARQTLSFLFTREPVFHYIYSHIRKKNTCLPLFLFSALNNACWFTLPFLSVSAAAMPYFAITGKIFLLQFDFYFLYLRFKTVFVFHIGTSSPFRYYFNRQLKNVH